MSATDDALNALCGAVVEAARNAAPALVTAAQADDQAALAALQTQLEELRAVETNVQTQLDDANAQVRQDRADLAASQAQTAAVQAAFDAYRQLYPPTPPPPPPPVQTMLVGVHVEGAKRANWNIVRCYDDSMMRAAPASMGIAMSYTPICHPGWPGVPAAVAQVQAGLNALPDRENIWVCMSHEMEHPGQKYDGQQSQYISDEVVFAHMVRALKRTHPVRIFRNAMAFSVLPAQATARGIDGFFASGDYDAVGMDVYSNTQVQAAIDYAAKWHKPLVIPEQGLESAIPHNDPAVLAYMQASIPKYRAANAAWLTWFDHTGSGAELSQYPNGLSYLKSQIAA